MPHTLFIEALQNHQIDKVIECLDKNPELINTPLTSLKETALMIAAKFGYEDVVRVLLERGADVQAVTLKGDYPITLAFESGNEAVSNLIQSYTPQCIGSSTILNRLSETVLDRITRIEKTDAILCQLKIALLVKMDRFLNEFTKKASLDEANTVDIYLMFNGLMQCIDINDIKTFKEKILTLFDARSIRVKGTSFDYNIPNQALLNSCLREFVALIWQKEIEASETTINQLLFHDAVTRFNHEENRWLPVGSEYVPYMDLESSAPMLPAGHEFIRDTEDHIHELDKLIETAITNLKQGKIKPDEIWVGCDEREEAPSPLSSAVISHLVERSQSIKALSQYITNRYQDNLSKGIRLKFEALRDGLIKGDRTHGGSQYFAGSDAATAQVTFTEWWYELKRTNPALQESILSYRYWDLFEKKWISMKDIIAPILDGREQADRSNVVFCVETMGRRLDHLLSDLSIQAQMAEDSQLSIREWSQPLLESEKIKCLTELKKGKTISDKTNLPNAYPNPSQLLVWFAQFKGLEIPFNYFDIKKIDALSQHRGDAFKEALEQLSDAPLLLEKDIGFMKDLAIMKDFTSFLLSVSEELQDEDWRNISYFSLKAIVQQWLQMKKPIPEFAIAHSLNTALVKRDVDWLLFLVKHDLIDPAKKLCITDWRFPELREGALISLPSSSSMVAHYQIIKRKGSKLLLSLREEGPEEDIEISLSNDRDRGLIKYLDPSTKQYCSLSDTSMMGNLANCGLVMGNATLFRYLTTEKKVRPDMTLLVDSKTNQFIQRHFAKDILYFLAKNNPFQLTRVELTCLVKAVLLSEQYELLKPLVELGLSLDKRVSKIIRYDLDTIKRGYIYRVKYGDQWIPCRVTKLHEKEGVNRALFQPVQQTDYSGLLPRWVTLSLPSELAEVYDDRARCYLSKSSQTQALPIFEFVFKENNLAVWPYLVKNKLARDDSLLIDASVKQCCQYVECLTFADLTLSNNCTKILLEKVLSTTPLDSTLLAILTRNNFGIVKLYLNQERLGISPIEWAFSQQAVTLIPVLMSREESAPSRLISELFKYSPALVSSFFEGLRDNITSYELFLNEDNHWLDLFKAGFNCNLLGKYPLLMQTCLEKSHLDLIETVDALFPLINRMNDKVNNFILFCKDIYPIEDISQGQDRTESLIHENMSDELKQRIIKRLTQQKVQDKEMLAKRFKLAKYILTKAFDKEKRIQNSDRALITTIVDFLNLKSSESSSPFIVNFIKLSLQKYKDVSLVSPLINNLDENTQRSIRSWSMRDALRQESFPYFRDSVKDTAVFIQHFIKVYNALYNSQPYFFKCSNHWAHSESSLKDIFEHSLSKPHSRSHQALMIAIEEASGFDTKADEVDRLKLFNRIHRTSMASNSFYSLFSHTHLIREKERNLQYITEYAKDHSSSRTANICGSLEWVGAFKP